MSFAFPRLAGKTVLVTGASAGIGKATALLFAKSGSNLILVARRADKLEEVKSEIQKANKDIKVAVIPLDMSDRKAVASILDQIPADLKEVDVLVNNAGGVRGVEQVGDISLDDIDIMLSLNVMSLMQLTQIFVTEFKKRSKGHVINIGSVAGRESYPGGSVYCATKAAVRAFTGSLIRELVSTPIRVTEIQPGLVETEFSVIRFRGDKSKADKVYDGLQPLVGEDIAEEIVWAASRPAHVQIAEVFVMPVNQAAATLVHRGSK